MAKKTGKKTRAAKPARRERARRPAPRHGEVSGRIVGAEQAGDERMRVLFEDGGILLQTSAARATNSRILVKAIKELVARATQSTAAEVETEQPAAAQEQQFVGAQA